MSTSSLAHNSYASFKQTRVASGLSWIGHLISVAVLFPVTLLYCAILACLINWVLYHADLNQGGKSLHSKGVPGLVTILKLYYGYQRVSSERNKERRVVSRVRPSSDEDVAVEQSRELCNKEMGSHSSGRGEPSVENSSQNGDEALAMLDVDECESSAISAVTALSSGAAEPRFDHDVARVAPFGKRHMCIRRVLAMDNIRKQMEICAWLSEVKAQSCI